MKSEGCTESSTPAAGFPGAGTPALAPLAALMCAVALLLSGAACGAGGGGGEGERQSGGRGRGGGPPAGGFGKMGAGEKPAPPAIPVIVDRVTRTDMNAFLEASATLDAEETVDVVSEATGVVVEILAEEGDEVRQNQLIARLAYEELELAEARARTELERLTADFERSERLRDEKLVSEDEHQQIAFGLRRARIDWQQAKLELDRTRILAPIDGTITRRNIRKGSLVSKNEVAFEIVDFRSIVAPVYVSEQYLSNLYVGQRVNLTAPARPSMNVAGAVKRISPLVDADSGTVEVIVEVPFDRNLRPGMYVSAQIVLDTHEDALAIPKRALVYEDELPHVFVVEEGVAKRRELDLGYQEPERVEVVTGLSGDEWVVLVGQSALKEDSAVAAKDLEGNEVTSTAAEESHS